MWFSFSRSTSISPTEGTNITVIYSLGCTLPTHQWRHQKTGHQIKKILSSTFSSETRKQEAMACCLKSRVIAPCSNFGQRRYFHGPQMFSKYLQKTKRSQLTTHQVIQTRTRIITVLAIKSITELAIQSIRYWGYKWWSGHAYCLTIMGAIQNQHLHPFPIWVNSS